MMHQRHRDIADQFLHKLDGDPQTSAFSVVWLSESAVLAGDGYSTLNPSPLSKLPGGHGPNPGLVCGVGHNLAVRYRVPVCSTTLRQEECFRK